MGDAAVSLVIGAAAGLAVASLGAYKDTPYEPFSSRAFARSIVIACALVVATRWADWPHLGAASPLLVFLAVIAMERLVSETYKLFLRPAPVGRRIPSQVAVLGRPIQALWHRLFAGSLFVLVVAAILAVVNRVGFVAPGAESMALGLGAGALVGIGGAWKDAPIEGWSTGAFVRSPLIAASVPFVLSSTAVLSLPTAGTTDATTLFFVCLGGERLVVESYKAFVRRRCPSKFFMPLVGGFVPASNGRAKSRVDPLAGPAFGVTYCVAVVIAAIAISAQAR